MGKKKYEFIEKIPVNNSRNITFHKRIKGLLKKGIEMSVLCSQDVFIFVHDNQKERMLNFASNPELDFLSLFNRSIKRQFVNNNFYQQAGGDIQSWGCQREIPVDECKRFLKDDWGDKITSMIGSLNDMMNEIPAGKSQMIDCIPVNDLDNKEVAAKKQHDNIFKIKHKTPVKSNQSQVISEDSILEHIAPLSLQSHENLSLDARQDKSIVLGKRTYRECCFDNFDSINDKIKVFKGLRPTFDQMELKNLKITQQRNKQRLQELISNRIQHRDIMPPIGLISRHSQSLPKVPIFKIENDQPLMKTIKQTDIKTKLFRNVNWNFQSHTPNQQLTIRDIVLMPPFPPDNMFKIADTKKEEDQKKH